MGIKRELHTLKPKEWVELFVFDDTIIGGSQVLRWYSGTSSADLPIVWQGFTYNPYPVQITGFEMNSAGQLPRPKLTGSNIGGLLGSYLESMSDALGSKVTRKRTLGKYLDAVNFTGGNPTADPNQYVPDETYYVAQKLRENPIFIEIELASAHDAAGILLPRRQVIAGTCQWVYRSAECTYAGPAVQDINGNPTTSLSEDRCRKTLSACRARFGQNGVLMTSAFPSSLLTRYS